MAYSMTGYGRSANDSDAWNFIWEIRSVNSRFLDIKWRIPGFLRAMEPVWEKDVRAFAGRGRVDVNLLLRINKAEVLGMTLNQALATAMLDQVGELADRLSLNFHPDLNRLLPISGLWQEGLGGPDQVLAEDLSAGLREALEDWQRFRVEEGRFLVEDLNNRLNHLNSLLTGIRERVPRVKQEKAEALVERIRTAMEQAEAPFDPDRMLQETAMLADRLDVSEELTRLESHLDQWRRTMSNNGEVGRKLDFLLQECFREINTCGTKSQDSDISHMVVEFKAQLEKCREQVQNLE